MPEMTYTERLVVTSCWCGINLAVPATLERHARQDKSNVIYCPLGHTFVYGDTFKEKFERERDRLADESRRHRATRELLRAEERSHSATRGHLTRTKKRVAHGVCPCCNRHFANVERHLASQHPDYVEEAGT